MKTVVISDIHNKINTAQKILDSEPADEYVFLGDYFDDFEDTAKIAQTTAYFLKEILERSDCVCLWGNHDVPYRWSHNHYARCPGFDNDKCRAINHVISPELWDTIRWYYHTQGWYMSHAGFADDSFNVERIVSHGEEYLDDIIHLGLKQLDAGLDPCHCWMGYRMGVMRKGGLTWMDWNSFEPIVGINQIVGHTYHGCVRVKYAKKHRSSHKNVSVINSHFEEKGPAEDKILSLNYCIDSYSHGFGRAYAVIEDGKATIKYIP
jgi:hypothetical protein